MDAWADVLARVTTFAAHLEVVLKAREILNLRLPYIYIYKTKNHSFLLLCMKNSSMRITSRMPKSFALNKNTLSDLATSGIITIYFSF